MSSCSISEVFSITDFNSNQSICSDFIHESILDLASAMNEMDEQLILAQNGYTKHEIISTTLQGEIFSAKLIGNEQSFVAIKKACKILTSKRECLDNDGFNFIIDENICSEALILKYVTQNNNLISNNIIQYVEFFESETDYYLVMEYVESQFNLKQFAIKAHEYIRNGQLKLKQYNKALKYILWQTSLTIDYLHNSMQCVHLDIFPENIMLTLVPFTEQSNGSVDINSEIKIKLLDFGVSTNRDITSMDANRDVQSEYFRCNKQFISIQNAQYLAPNITRQSHYNGKSADLWSLGMVFYFCCFGEYPYKYIEETEFNEPIIGTPYCAVYTNQLSKWLRINHLMCFINNEMVSLLNGLLDVNEDNRYTSKHVIKHTWFNEYYNNQKNMVERIL
eukprot:92748_1